MGQWILLYTITLNLFSFTFFSTLRKLFHIDFFLQWFSITKKCVMKKMSPSDLGCESKSIQNSLWDLHRTKFSYKWNSKIDYPIVYILCSSRFTKRFQQLIWLFCDWLWWYWIICCQLINEWKIPCSQHDQHFRGKCEHKQ